MYIKRRFDLSNSTFKHVKIKGITTVVPEKYIDIDDEIKYFDNDEKKLNRAKKIIGYGRRHIVDKGVTVVDLCEEVANNLILEMNINKDEIDALVLVNQSPDYLIPSSSCILHGRLSLKKDCATIDVSQGCSGYVYGLWLAHSLIESQAAKKVLLLAGDNPSTHSNIKNRLVNQLFGDAASATLIEYSEEEIPSYFVVGSDGAGWDRIIAPATGRRLQPDLDTCQEVIDKAGNVWRLSDTIIHGMDVFNFTLNVVPENINDVLEYANMTKDEIDFFAIHQANKQIVETIVTKAKIPVEKCSTETFSKYGNNSTTSVATVICDQLKNKKVDNVLLCAFGVGLSWASAIIDFRNIYNGGIKFYKTPDNLPTREEQIEHWIRQFKGE